LPGVPENIRRKETMRTKEEILHDHNSYNVLTLEVLLDLRELLVELNKRLTVKKQTTRKKTKTPSANKK